MTRWEIIFTVTCPLWIASLIIGLQVTEGAGLLVNIICTIVTGGLLALNLYAWMQGTDPEYSLEKPKSAIDRAADDLFEKLKKEM